MFLFFICFGWFNFAFDAEHVLIIFIERNCNSNSCFSFHFDAAPELDSPIAPRVDAVQAENAAAALLVPAPADHSKDQ